MCNLPTSDAQRLFDVVEEARLDHVLKGGLGVRGQGPGQGQGQGQGWGRGDLRAHHGLGGAWRQSAGSGQARVPPSSSEVKAGEAGLVGRLGLG